MPSFACAYRSCSPPPCGRVPPRRGRQSDGATCAAPAGAGASNGAQVTPARESRLVGWWIAIGGRTACSRPDRQPGRARCGRAEPVRSSDTLRAWRAFTLVRRVLLSRGLVVALVRPVLLGVGVPGSCARGGSAASAAAAAPPPPLRRRPWARRQRSWAALHLHGPSTTCAWLAPGRRTPRSSTSSLAAQARSALT